MTRPDPPRYTVEQAHNANLSCTGCGKYGVGACAVVRKNGESVWTASRIPHGWLRESSADSLYCSEDCFRKWVEEFENRWDV